MERIETISHSLMAKAPEKTPEMQEEIDRLKI
jgi:acyl-CoA oxidase